MTPKTPKVSLEEEIQDSRPDPQISLDMLLYFAMRKNIFCLILYLLFVLMPVSVFASEVKEFILNNGMKVIILEEHKAPAVTFQIWYRVGSKDEPNGKSGLSHLLEHMMFKGTKIYGASEFSRIIQKNGGTDNAFTTKDYTAYFEILPSDKINIAIELEADRMKNLVLDPKECVLERDVVVEERKMRYEDDPQNLLFEEVNAIAYKIHPYRRPVIGWMSEISSIERQDLYEYYSKYYSPNNAFIVVVGDINVEEVLRAIKDKFEGMSGSINTSILRFDEPEQSGERRFILKKEAELPFVVIAYHVPNFPHEDSFALDVLSLILAGGKSSRLYQSLVYERRIALNVSADYHGFNVFPYLFFISATVSPNGDVKEVESSIYNEIRKIVDEAPSEYEVQKAKNQLEASFIMDQDSIYMQAMKFGIFEILGSWRLFDKYLEGIRKVTPTDIVNVAKKYFIEDKRIVGTLIPKKVEASR